ncbi:MAG: rhodanese-like domain-containing protein [Clostridia bacterium]|nr:rhodanese-like domain-containing protein [Clostridia bacterium]
MKKFLTLIFMCTAMTLTGCRAFNVYDRDGMVRENTYTQISQDEAKAMMSSDSGYVIVDVRTVDEFSSGHIPNAICIPNEDITTSKPELLPDINQEILVYCRSGRRSKEASQKLADIGYTNVYEFGGIIDWTGEVVTE